MNDQPAKRRFNWWMLAFFVALLAFEFTRELWVVSAHEPMVGDNFMLHGGAKQGYVSASGQWIRSDGGSRILPGTVKIECFNSAEPMCIEASATYFDGSRSAPIFIELFTTTEFTDSAVTYENDNPGCAKYTVRLDLVQKRVTATRVKKATPELPDCDKLEERVAMELGSGFDHMSDGWMDNHFLPIFNANRAISR